MKKRKNGILIDARIGAGLTQEDMAELLNINPSSYSRYETLRIYPPEEIQKKIILYFAKKGIDLQEKKVFSRELYEKSDSDRMISREKNPVLVNMRESLGFSQRKLSQELGINAAMYGNYESLRVYPSLGVQKNMVSYFEKMGANVVAEYLFPKELYKSDDEINKKGNKILTGARESLGLTRKEFAKQAGINFRTYAQYENLRLHPSLSAQKKISAYLRQNGVQLIGQDLFPDEIYVMRKKNKNLDFIQSRKII